MAKNRAKRVPRLKSVDELVEFVDKHGMGDYWDRLPIAEFEVKIKTRPKKVTAIAIDKVLRHHFLTRLPMTKKASGGARQNVRVW